MLNSANHNEQNHLSSPSFFQSILENVSIISVHPPIQHICHHHHVAQWWYLATHTETSENI